MSQTFKFGDKVRFISEKTRDYRTRSLVLGKVYNVTEIRAGYENTMALEESDFFQNVNDFQLAQVNMSNYDAACKEVDLMDVCATVKAQIKKVLAKTLGVEVKEERTYRVGDVFKRGDLITELVATPDERVLMVVVARPGVSSWGGEFWAGNCRPKDSRKITTEEMKIITNREWVTEPFTYIGHCSEVIKVIEK